MGAHTKGRKSTKRCRVERTTSHATYRQTCFYFFFFTYRAVLHICFKGEKIWMIKSLFTFNYWITVPDFC